MRRSPWMSLLVLAIARPALAQQTTTIGHAPNPTALWSRAVSQRLWMGAFGPSPAPQTAPTGTFMDVGFSGLVDAGWSTEPDVRSLQTGDHDPAQRGFTVPNIELTLAGAVDPFLRGFSAIVYKIDEEGESGLELEEAYFYTTSLPGNLQIKGGQFFAEFGRQNQQHPHAWAFVDQPLVMGRLFGADGFRGQGARVSWLAPTSWYTEVALAVMNSHGETAFSFRSEESPEIHGGVPAESEVEGPGDLLYVPRVNVSFDLSETQTAVLGASAAFGPNNSGESARTQLLGADLYWKWKSPIASAGFPFVSFQSEAMMRSYEAAVRIPEEDPGDAPFAAETLHDQGASAELLWGIKPRIVTGLRGEFVDGDEGQFESELRTQRYRISPNLTWYPSEFSKVRVQYNYDHRQDIGADHSLWVQLEFIMGAHAAHRF